VALRSSQLPDLAPRSSGTAPALRPARPCRPVADNHGPPPGSTSSPPSALGLTVLPPSFPGRPTSPPAPPDRPQSCSEPFVLKPPPEDLDESPASPPTTAARFVAVPQLHFAAIDFLTIEPKSQPGRKRGNQVNQETGERDLVFATENLERGKPENKGRDLVFATENLERL
jgi:hypothetical protein